MIKEIKLFFKRLFCKHNKRAVFTSYKVDKKHFDGFSMDAFKCEECGKITISY